VSDVWPKLFDYVEDPIQRELLRPSLSGLRPGAILGWVIQARDSRGGTIADDFRIVDLRAAAIGARNDQPAEGVPGAVEEATVSLGEISRILFEDYWQHELREGIAQGLVGEDMPVVAREGVCTVAELGHTVLRHANSSEKAHIDERGIVEAVIPEEVELAHGIERRHTGVGAYCAVVGDDI